MTLKGKPKYNSPSCVVFSSFTSVISAEWAITQNSVPEADTLWAAKAREKLNHNSSEGQFGTELIANLIVCLIGLRSHFVGSKKKRRSHLPKGRKGKVKEETRTTMSRRRRRRRKKNICNSGDAARKSRRNLSLLVTLAVLEFQSGA